ncbi:MAG: hypothetical protein J6B87_04255 [Clostridia bacterium]|nr:hypothetical protein [Clostridia bacterium]
MKIIEFKEYNNDNFQSINKKKIVATVTIATILVIILVFILFYFFNKNFRNWADMHILMKTITEGKLSSIEIDSSEKLSIYAYDKYIAVINVDKLEIYNSSAKKISSIDVNIDNPTFESKGRYMVIGDKGKKRVYLVSGTKVIWNTQVDGSISRVSVNENGYVSVISASGTYKSIIAVFNPSGEQLFKTFIPTNTVIDSTISSDNKYLSFAEIDTTKTAIQSIVKTQSIKDAMEASNNSIIHTYEMPVNSLIVSLKYQGSKNLLCMCDDGIQLLADGNMQQVANFSEEGKLYSFAGIGLSNTIYKVDESSDGISNQKSELILVNTGTKKQNTYTIEGIAKDTAASDDNIAINLGSEIYFVSSRGWLIKKYVANQEIRDVIVSDRIAAIIFRDKVEILIL